MDKFIRHGDENMALMIKLVNAVWSQNYLEFPQIVCLCGSTKFKKQFEYMNKKLTTEGNIVLSVGWFAHCDKDMPTEEQKRNLDELHLRKIDLADRVVIISVDGYIGESTRREIAYAQKQGKSITYCDFENNWLQDILEV